MSYRIPNRHSIVHVLTQKSLLVTLVDVRINNLPARNALASFSIVHKSPNTYGNTM